MQPALIGGPGVAIVVAAATSTGAVITLVVMLAAMVMFTIGVLFARSGRYDAHGRIQTIAFAANTALVLAWMVQSFVRFVIPAIPGELGQRSYAVTTVHAGVGLVGMLLGLYAVLLGWGKLPAALRSARKKAVMRVSYVLYLLATLGGVTVFWLLYGPGSS
jgi:uncharacterized membrane protein YozB (DUF420 family)